jgi:tetratricopeptide (TPR) repeat protein
MAIQKRTMTWLLFLLLVFPGMAFAERKGRLIGKIVDPDGKPIPGVTVTVTSPQVSRFKDVETTDKRGMFIVDFSQVNVTYRYRFDKVGYTTMQFEQLWELEGTQQMDWTMQPGQSAAVAAGGAPPASTSQTAIAAYNQGLAALKAKDTATAEAKFKEAVGNDPKFLQAWEALSSAELELGKNQEAAEAAEKAIALGATAEPVYLTRWKAYSNLNDEAKTAEALDDLKRIGKQTEEAKRLHNEAVTLEKAGDQAGAFAKFQEALKLDPTLEASQLGLATAALKLGKNAEAVTAAQSILRKDPKNEAAIRIRYNAALALGDKAELVDALVGLAAIDPTRARDGLLKMAFDAYDNNDMVQAKGMFAKALQVDPNYALAHYYIGLICVGQGASEEARSHFERFLQLAPNDKEAESVRDMLKYLAKN